GIGSNSTQFSTRSAESSSKGFRVLVRLSGVEPKRQEFAEFYTAVKDECLRIVLVSVGDRALAEELVAEAFARAWTSWRTVRVHPMPRAWVVRTALNAHVSLWRRRRREVPLDAAPLAMTGVTSGGLHESTSVDDVLVQAIRALPMRQREVIVYRV